MGAAIKEIWPQTKFGVGPAINNGFYYDVDLGQKKISTDDFKKIEETMRKIVSQKLSFDKFNMPIDQAIEWAKENNQTYKLDLLNDLKKYGTTNVNDIEAMNQKAKEKSRPVDEVSFYKIGNFVDLCKGPHIASTEMGRVFKIMKVSGVYWRGDEKNPQMQRVYGVSFKTQEELDDYLDGIEKAKENDHRKLGYDLDIYTMSDLVGAGLPLFTPRGTALRNVLANYSNQLRIDRGFQMVWTPHITKKALYEKSGHWAKFGEELFLVKSQETGDQMVLKPMNCPHHAQIFASRPRSYKDMPVRYLETTTDYRDEKSGELSGLSRVRSLTQDDSHIFCMPDQIEHEIDSLLSAAEELYSVMKMKLRVRLSYRDDTNKYLGSKELWESTQKQLKEAVVKNGLNYFEKEGEAAFYGPKIDFMATDALNREHQVATVQLDFVQPERFELKYTDADGQQKTPVMIHCALLGSIERFISVFLEHTGGIFPFWTAPEQIRVITINDKVNDYADKIGKMLKKIVLMKPVRYNELRFSIDNQNESLNKKIIEAEKMHVPVIFVVGPRDKENEVISVRIKNKTSIIKLNDLNEFIKQFECD